MRMIVLRFLGSNPDQIEKYLSDIQKHWTKTRGPGFWKVELTLKDKIRRELQNQYLVIVEWNLPWAHPEGSPKNTVVFLFDTIQDSCDVFIVAMPNVDERIAKAIVMAFEDFASPDDVNLAAYSV
jgi:hypothetical protein